MPPPAEPCSGAAGAAPDAAEYRVPVVDRSDGMAEELRTCCAAFPSLDVATTTGRDSVLVRLSPVTHAEDIADEVYEQVARNVRPGHGMVLMHAIVEGRAALEMVAEDSSATHEELQSVIADVVAEFDRLVGLWHPHLPADGA